jgi:tRNA threonylcarbamoyladenosine biosynthesis protein TsaB
MIVAQDALHTLDTSVPNHDNEFWVAMDARMDEVYAARYRWSTELSPARWQVTSPPALYTLAALSAAWEAEPPACVAGSAIDAFGDRLSWGSARRVPASRSRAAALAALARASWSRGEAVDAALALPIYLRDKVAQTTAERDAVRAARELAA